MRTVRFQRPLALFRGHRKSSQKPIEMNKSSFTWNSSLSLKRTKIRTSAFNSQTGVYAKHCLKPHVWLCDPPPPPPPPAPLKPNIGPPFVWSVIANENYVIAWLPIAGRTSRGESSASIARAPARSLAVLAVNVDRRPVLLPSSRFRHNALFLSSFSCSLIAVELHCDAWCSHEVHSTLQPLCGSVRVRCCRIFVIALPWVRSKFEQLQGRPGTA